MLPILYYTLCSNGVIITHENVYYKLMTVSSSLLQDALHALSTANTTTGVAVANATMSTFMSDLDRLLASSDGFLLGQWVTNARNVVNWSNVTQSLSSPSSPSSSPSSSSPPSSSSSSEGSSDLMADFLEWNARAQVTSWVPALGDACEGTAKALPPLYDYGNKAWAGLVKGCVDRVR